MFSRTTRYAIRSLAYIVNKGTLSSLPEISEKVDIPPDYLKKILIKLQKAGILKSTKGKMGGYYLANDPSVITIREIIKVFETFGLEDCKQPGCEECIAHAGMIKIERKIIEALNDITLKDFKKEAKR